MNHIHDDPFPEPQPPAAPAPYAGFTQGGYAPAPVQYPYSYPPPPNFYPAMPAAAASSSAATVIVGGGHRPFNHVLHLVLTCATCGLWAPIWGVAYAIHRGGGGR